MFGSPGPLQADHRQLLAGGLEASIALVAEEALEAVEDVPIPVLEQAALARQRAFVTAQLVHAGRSMLTALEAVGQDDELWRRLARGADRLADPIPRELEMQLREIVAHDVTALLLSVGYPKPPPPPPPPVDHWSEWTIKPLERVLLGDADSRVAERRAAEARRRLAHFTHRFRGVLARFEADAVPVPEVDDRRARRVLAAAVAAARERGVPLFVGAVAAGLVAAGAGFVFGGGLGAVGGAAVFGAIGGDAAKDVIKEVVAAAVTEGLAHQGDVIPATAAERVASAAAVLTMSLEFLVAGRDPRQWAVIAGHEVLELVRALQERADEPGFVLDPMLEHGLLRLPTIIRDQRTLDAWHEWHALRDRWAFLGG